jgi:hypothetical protein
MRAGLIDEYLLATDAIPDLELPDLLVAWRARAWLRRVAGRAKPEYRDQLRIAGKPAGPR